MNLKVPNMNFRSAKSEHISRTNINITNIINKVVEQYVGDKQTTISKLSELPLADLEYGRDNNTHPYYCKLAIEEKEQNQKTYVDPRIIQQALQNVTKKTNYFYKKKVHENKDKYGRISATKSFLSSTKKKG